MTRNHLLSASVLLMMSVFGASSAQAQTKGWLRGPGSATKACPYYNLFND